MGLQVKTRWMLIGSLTALAIWAIIIIGFYNYGGKENTDNIPAKNGSIESLTLGKDGWESGSIGNKTTEGCEDIWRCNIRLDPNVVPVNYDLFLFPDIKGGTFLGNVSIELHILETVGHLRLHTYDLNITKTTLCKVNSTDVIPLKDTFEWKENEFWVIVPFEQILPGKYNLTVHFHGSLTNGIVGLYRSEYYDPVQNKQMYLVSSKFQPTYARKAFPCFDEPSFKSTFTVTLMKPMNMWALSNMPWHTELGMEPDYGLDTVVFRKSLPMVTYLLSVAIGEFSFREEKTKSGVAVAIWSTPFQHKKTQYASEIAPKMLEFYEDYFGIKYPLPKLDIIGIPDFVSGAMEHWGMISFRETNLFYEDGVSSAGNKQRVASVISHEIAHQWFGNLVTLKWWDELWLNEGFASYMEYKGVNAVHPEWEMNSQFVPNDLTPVMVLDGQMNSHPIVQPVSHPDQITEIFDSISYNKGASVIRMLENFMGPEKFRRGVSKFLKKYSYKNAATSDLWNELQSETKPNINISHVMDTWTRQMGYPVIIANVCDGKLRLQQTRFMESQFMMENQIPSIFNYSWEVPLKITTSVNDSHIQPFWLKLSQEKATMKISNDSKWVKVNAGQFGFFRVKYSNDSLKGIQNSFLTSFTPEERCGLLDDAFALAYGRYHTYSTVLEFAKAIRHDTHFVPWDCLFPHLKKVAKILRNSAPESYAQFQKYITNLTSVAYAAQNWSDDAQDPHLNRLLKFDIIALSCDNGHVSCLEQAHILFGNWINKGEEVTPGLRGIVYKYGMGQSNATVWPRVFKVFMRETDPQEKIRLISCLAASKDPFILQRLLQLAKNESIIRRQDFFIAFKYIAANPIGNGIAWNFYRNEYPFLLKRFTANDRQFGRAILEVTSDFSTHIQYDEIEHFFSHHPEAGAGRRARATALEKVKNNIEWARVNVDVIGEWLNSQNY